jgi:DNA-directed RNA polymerase subunit M/transcription elongation factor TFIIS
MASFFNNLSNLQPLQGILQAFLLPTVSSQAVARHLGNGALMVDIAAAIGMAAQAIGIAKDLREIDRGVSEGEFKAKMADLYSSLADVKMALADAQEELKAKDNEIALLRKNFENSRELVERYGYKYEAGAEGQPQGLPFCPRCEQNSGRYYRLAQIAGPRGQVKCPECKSDFTHVTAYRWDNDG